MGFAVDLGEVTDGEELAAGQLDEVLDLVVEVEVWPVHTPVVASKAARPLEVIAEPFLPFWTPVKLPPTYMVEPTCSKAWTWMLPSWMEPLRLPVTPHAVGLAYSETEAF